MTIRRSLGKSVEIKVSPEELAKIRETQQKAQEKIREQGYPTDLGITKEEWNRRYPHKSLTVEPDPRHLRAYCTC